MILVPFFIGIKVHTWSYLDPFQIRERDPGFYKNDLELVCELGKYFSKLLWKVSFLKNYAFYFQANIPHVKTAKKTLQKAKELGNKENLQPNEIYERCIKPECIISSMKGLKQAQYCKECSNKAKNPGFARGNPADQWVQVIRQVQDKENWPYIRFQFLDDVTGLPNAIIYSDSMIDDMRNLCGSDSDPSTVLGVSRCTFSMINTWFHFSVIFFIFDSL